MSKKNDSPSFMVRLATLIVDKRNLIFFLYICAAIFSIFSRNWVQVCNDITQYLPPTTETRQGLTLMQEETTTFATARVMVSHVTLDTAEHLADQLAELEGVTSATLGNSLGPQEETTPTPEEINSYCHGDDALISVTFAGEETDPVSLEALGRVRELLAPYDVQIDTPVGSDSSTTLQSEMDVILVIAAIVILLVLLLTSKSYAEIPVLVITFGAAAVLNLGTNFLLGEISFVSNSVTVILQLALAIDYAIILLHRFLEEREHAGDREACITALSVSIPSISASSLTTISGLAAMMFMEFRIGFDMGLVLIKAICLSMLSVFTLMPGLLMIFCRAMDRTRHKNFIPSIDRWGKLVVKLRYVGVPVFAVCLVGAFFLSNQCPYVYGYSEIHTARQNEAQIAQETIDEAFGSQNVMAMLVPRGDYESEKALLNRLETYEEIDSALGLANIEAMDGYTLTDALTPREFSELIDLDYEQARLLYAAYAADREEYGRIVGGVEDYKIPLMDLFLFIHDCKEDGYITLDDELNDQIDDLYTQLTDARAQMLGENYSRLVLTLNLPEEGEETFAFLQTLHKEAERYYPAESVYLVGDSTSDYDLSTSFARDNILISVLTVVFVIVVLLFTFLSVGLPILLILVIQGSVWLNFAFPGFTGEPIFFMSYLIVTAIQMGANIDYAIVISTWYNDLKTTMPKKEAIIRALSLSFPTVLTSGSILSIAAFLIAQITTEPSIVGIGQCLCRGTLISMFLVMFILPQILLLGDSLVERTRFNIKLPVPDRGRLTRGSGSFYVNGRVRGQVNGIIDADVRGVIRGTVSATVETGQDGIMPDEPALPETAQDEAFPGETAPEESEANEPPSDEGKEEPHDETTVE